MLNNETYDEKLIEDFVDQAIADKGIPVNNEERNNLIEELSDRIEFSIIAALPEEDLDQLNSMLSSDFASEDELEKLIKNADLDLKTITTNAMNSFRTDYLNRKEDNNAA